MAGGRDKVTCGVRGDPEHRWGNQGGWDLSPESKTGREEMTPHWLCGGYLAPGIHTGHLVKSSVVRQVKRLAQSHPVSQRQSQDYDQRCPCCCLRVQRKRGNL